jgi:hypothetical protein
VPTFVASYGPAGLVTGANSVTGTVAVGDVLILWAAAGNSTNVISGSTSAGVTWTLQRATGNAGSSWPGLLVWTGTSTVAGSFTVSMSPSDLAMDYTYGMMRFSNAGGVGNTAFQWVNATANPSLTLATQQASSSMAMIVSDWNVRSGTRTYVTATAGAFTETNYATATGADVTAFAGYYANTGVAGSKTVGMTAPTGQVPASVAVEILPAGTAPATDPGTIASLVNRWIASDIQGAVTGTGIGSAGLTWFARAGGASMTQSTAANQPTYQASSIGGKPALRFDGSTDSIAAATGTARAQPHTVVIVAKLNTAPAAGTLWQPVDFSNPQVLVNGTQWSLWEGTTNINGGTANTTATVITAIGNGASSAIYKDGTLVASGNPGTGSSSGTLTLGTWTGGAGRFAPIDIAEVLWFSTGLTPAERATVHTYVQNTYGITVSDFTSSAKTSAVTALGTAQATVGGQRIPTAALAPAAAGAATLAAGAFTRPSAVAAAGHGTVSLAGAFRETADTLVAKAGTWADIRALNAAAVGAQAHATALIILATDKYGTLAAGAVFKSTLVGNLVIRSTFPPIQLDAVMTVLSANRLIRGVFFWNGSTLIRRVVERWNGLALVPTSSITIRSTSGE